MVDLSGGVAGLPANKRLDELRKREAERIKEFERELDEKRKELRELEQRRKEEIAETEELAEETLEELAERQEEEIAALEERIREFRESGSAVETLEETVRTPAPSESYGMSDSFKRMRAGVDYLLNAEASAERQAEVGRGLYDMARWVSEHTGELSEDYRHELQESVEKLKEQGGISGAYANRIENVLTDIIQYRS